jgi:ketosteroid isomerase-like protein
MSSDAQRVMDAAVRIADAIGKRDVGALGRELAPGFLMRTPGGDTRAAAAFLDAISQIPGEIVFVKLVALNVDVSGDGALATGVQHAQVRMDGQTIDDKRPFVDWFVKHEGEWRLRLAVDLPAAAEEAAGAPSA